MGLEIRDFEGDATVLADFVNSHWRRQYHRRVLTPHWPPEYFEWQLPNVAVGDMRLVPAAYDRGRLVGVFPGEEVPISLMGKPAMTTMSSWLTVDPNYQRTGVGRMLLAAMSARNLAIDSIFNGGFVNHGLIRPAVTISGSTSFGVFFGCLRPAGCWPRQCSAPSCLALTPPDAKGAQRSATRKVGRDRTPGVIG
jgi:GNAT superfamily N-acetyltransferase